MRELTVEEINSVAGAGFIRDGFDDIWSIVSDFPEFYQDLVNSTADMMCIGTGNC